MDEPLATSGPAQHVQEVQMLFLQHADLLRGFLRGLVPQQEVADDIFQELFLTLTAKAHDFQLGSNFLAWARTVARLKVFEQYRQLKRSVPLLSAEVLEVLADEAPQADGLLMPRYEALQGCLQQIAPRAREMVSLRYADPPLTPRQIARQLSWTANAVRVALARARKFLHECVERRLALKGQA
ncbi:MAG: sigma-70 family RNA polymerase sigma factor [Planctomycetia bacterium]|nr:sigma-70 family RNA polymerase sigma factor [Planctomycetia bacterium]